ncbi:GNAT family N-acetyltransferase [Lactobacillus helsingborgensis]|uniref:GNAT family N-acetyltransferase n=1 Tax=Lactobacillus helsingborgensis TaxID=1218494 RepID=UPI00164F8AAB|nr:GNAT family N-acetyltransferase [Lactobacillus helsingborgensis]MBC6356882.1 GNAT family N-acetyltransferase [Lactobacillus helsingborgensis]
MNKSIFQKIAMLSQKNALIIADKWHYNGQYAFYNMKNDQEDYDEIISPQLRKNNYFQVLDEDDNLVAFFCLDPDKEKKEQVEVGLELSPNLTGRGLGSEFMTVIENYVKNNYDYQVIVLAVAEFNLRAIKVYQKAAYVNTGTEMVHSNGGIYKFNIMTKNFERNL